MRKVLTVLIILLTLLGVAAADSSYVDVATDTNVAVNGNFGAQVEVSRGAAGSEGGLTFYNDNGNAYYFKVRWADANRVDFYGSKDLNGVWNGFLISEEYDASKKDCFVSVDEGWDATADTAVTLTVNVEGNIATVTITGNNTGKSGTLHFDLTKSAYLDGYKEETPTVLTNGAMHYVGACDVLSMALARDTYEALFGPLTIYNELPKGTSVEVTGDFSAQVVVGRENGSLDGGLLFYGANGYAYSFKVRWNENNRVDFYGSKDVNGAWGGFLISEEYDESKKDCFVSLDEGWDASADTAVTMTVTVEGTMATVTVAGNNTGKSGTLHFDLSKSPWLGGYTEENPQTLTGGTLEFTGSGNIIQMALDSKTYEAIFGQPVEEVTYTWFPNNTANVAGLSMNDLGRGSNWRNVLPVDLSRNGTQTYALLAADAFIIGEVTVTVADGAVTVTADTYYGEIYLTEATVTWFASLDEVTDDKLMVPGDYGLGEAVPVSGNTAILYLNGKVTFRQPYNEQGMYLPRYWRNTPAWVSYRQWLSTMVNNMEVDTSQWIEVPVDSRIAVSGDFSAKLVVQRDGGNLDGGLMFYHNDASGYGFKVRWNEDSRADLYGIKDVAGAWGGFLICEEYQEWLKDCFVSVDEGWDATADTAMILTIEVQGTMATVTMEGNVTGKSGTIHFDLTKSPWLDWEEKELEPLVLSEGSLFYAGSGTPVQLFVDPDTYHAQ